MLVCLARGMHLRVRIGRAGAAASPCRQRTIGIDGAIDCTDGGRWWCQLPCRPASVEPIICSAVNNASHAHSQRRSDSAVGAAWWRGVGRAGMVACGSGTRAALTGSTQHIARWMTVSPCYSRHTMLSLDAAATHERLPVTALIDALRAMAVEGCVVPQRQVHTVAEGAAPGRLLLMAAWQPGRYLGVKTVTVFAANATRGLPSLHARVHAVRCRHRRAAGADRRRSAHRAAHGVRVGAGRVIPGARRRDALAGGRRRPRRLTGAVGDGRGAADRAACGSWNHRSEGAHTLARSLCEQGLRAEATDDLHEAVQHADIVSCATLATQPLIRGEWLQPGTHLDLIGSFAPDMREADALCVGRARVFVDHDEALAKAGDLLQAIARARFERDALQGTLEQLCRGQRGGRANASEITLFKSVGSAWQDLAAARLVIDRAGLIVSGRAQPPA